MARFGAAIGSSVADVIRENIREMLARDDAESLARWMAASTPEQVMEMRVSFLSLWMAAFEASAVGCVRAILAFFTKHPELHRFESEVRRDLLLRSLRTGLMDFARECLVGAPAIVSFDVLGTVAVQLVHTSDLAALRFLADELHGALDGRDASGDSLLHVSVRLRREAITAWLLARGDVVGMVLHQNNLAGVAPLHIATAISSATAVEALLAAGADPTVPTQRASLPIHLAAAGLFASAESSRTTLFDRLLAVHQDRGLDVNVRGFLGRTVLHFLGGASSNEELASAVKSRFVGTPPDWDGPMHPRFMDPDAAEAFTPRFHRPLQPDCVQLTRMFQCSAAPVLRTVDALVRCGANLQQRDERGATALMYASASSFVALVRALVRRGALDFAQDEFDALGELTADEDEAAVAAGPERSSARLTLSCPFGPVWDASFPKGMVHPLLVCLVKVNQSSPRGSPAEEFVEEWRTIDELLMGMTVDDLFRSHFLASPELAGRLPPGLAPNDMAHDDDYEPQPQFRRHARTQAVERLGPWTEAARFRLLPCTLQPSLTWIFGFALETDTVVRFLEHVIAFVGRHHERQARVRRSVHHAFFGDAGTDGASSGPELSVAQRLALLLRLWADRLTAESRFRVLSSAVAPALLRGLNQLWSAPDDMRAQLWLKYAPARWKARRALLFFRHAGRRAVSRGEISLSPDLVAGGHDSAGAGEDAASISTDGSIPADEERLPRELDPDSEDEGDRGRSRPRETRFGWFQGPATVNSTTTAASAAASAAAAAATAKARSAATLSSPSSSTLDGADLATVRARRVAAQASARVERDDRRYDPRIPHPFRPVVASSSLRPLAIAVVEAIEAGAEDVLRAAFDSVGSEDIGRLLAVRDSDDRSFLHLAAARQRPAILRVLMEIARTQVSWDVNVYDRFRFSPLHYAAYGDEHGEAVSETAFSSSSASSSSSSTSTSSSTTSSSSSTSSSTSSPTAPRDAAATVAALIEAGATTRFSGWGGRLAVHCAVDPAVVSALMRARDATDLHVVDYADAFGFTPLVHAIVRGREATALALLRSLRARPPPHEPWTAECTAVVEAVRRPMPRVVEALAEHGFDLNRRNKRGECPLGVALATQRSSLVRLLLRLGAPPEVVPQRTMGFARHGGTHSLVPLALRLREWAGLRELLRGGANPSEVVDSQPLLLAALDLDPSLEGLRILARWGSDIEGVAKLQGQLRIPVLFRITEAPTLQPLQALLGYLGRDRFADARTPAEARARAVEALRSAAAKLLDGRLGGMGRLPDGPARQTLEAFLVAPEATVRECWMESPSCDWLRRRQVVLWRARECARSCGV